MIGFIAFLCGEPGVRYGVSFPMMSRAAFGIYGSYFVVLTKLLVNCVLYVPPLMSVVSHLLYTC